MIRTLPKSVTQGSQILYKFLLIVFHVLAMTSVHGQTSFLVGSASQSIEPDSTVFSVALAGYAAPKEGRFTITWKEMETGHRLKSISGFDGKLYGITRGHELLEGTISGHGIMWTFLGATENIKAFTGLNKKIFAINDLGELMSVDLTKGKTSWKKYGDRERLTTLTTLNGALYGASDRDGLFVWQSGRNAGWQRIDTIRHVASLTSNAGVLYALKTDNTIWKGKAAGERFDWTKIGRRNDFTFNIECDALAAFDNRLFALSDQGRLYKSAHSTNGDLSVDAMAISDKKNTTVIVAVDQRGLDYSFINDIKHAIWQRRQIPPDAIFINASHTHFAPIAQPLPAYTDFMQVPDSIYVNTIFRDGIIKAIESALDNMKPSRIYFGRSSTNIGHNRSSPDKKDPYDNTLDVLKAESMDGKNSNLLFLTGCHPVFRNTATESFTMSANYPGVTRRLLEAKAGYDNAIFVQGCGGDINPNDDDYEKTGLMLAIDVMSVVSSDMSEVKGGISYALDTILIPITPWSIDKIKAFKTDNSGAKDISREKNVRWADIMIKRYQQGTMPSQWPVYAHTLNIGNWKLIGLSREAVTEYGLAIKKLWPDQLVSVAGYTNDSNSYLPCKWHIAGKHYEGYESFFFHAQPAIPPANVMDIIVGEIKLKNR